jgi:putative dimethyl sulfoxide reductase chaperone
VETAAPLARSHLYRLLSDCFLFPEREFFEDVRSGDLEAELTEALDGLPYSIEPSGAFQGFAIDAETSYEEFQSGFIQHFEVGTAGPPCPLYGGIYQGGRNQVWEELIRFYNHFGLRLAPENRDLPDHVSTELEFMHYLCFREAVANDGAERGQLLTAQRDFLERHLARWLPLLDQRARKRGVAPTYLAVVTLTAAFVAAEHAYLARIH